MSGQHNIFSRQTWTGRITVVILPIEPPLDGEAVSRQNLLEGIFVSEYELPGKNR